MKIKREVFKMLELAVASTVGGILSYFITRFYDTGNYGYFYGFVGALISIGIFGYLFYRFYKTDND